VSFWDGRAQEGWEYPYPPEGVLCKGAKYALCADKGDKTVVICISQMKEDPEMAKEIFESFRWTE
jgi:hypothetical protein